MMVSQTTSGTAARASAGRSDAIAPMTPPAERTPKRTRPTGPRGMQSRQSSFSTVTRLGASDECSTELGPCGVPPTSGTVEVVEDLGGGPACGWRMRTIILDNEAIQALSQSAHAKHRAVVAHLAGVVVRRRKGAAVTAVVPTAVRVEAGWDRSDPRAATINWLRVADRTLDTEAANKAAGIVRRSEVSVADAHIGAVVQTLADDVVVLTRLAPTPN